MMIKNCYLLLLDLYAWIYYKYSGEKFNGLFNSEDILFRASLSRLIAKKIIKIKDLQSKFNISRERIIPFIIENSSSFDEIANIFLNCSNIVDALNLINTYYEEITNKLNKKEEKGIFSKFFSLFSSSKKEILLPAPSERDEIKPIFAFQQIILEKDNNNNFKNKFVIEFENVASKLIKENYKARNFQKLLDIKPMIDNLKKIIGMLRI